MQSIPKPGSGLQLAVLPFSSVPMHRRVLIEVVLFVAAELEEQLHKKGWDIRKLKLQGTFGGKPSSGTAPYNVFRDVKRPNNFVIVCPEDITSERGGNEQERVSQPNPRVPRYWCCCS